MHIEIKSLIIDVRIKDIDQDLISNTLYVLENISIKGRGSLDSSVVE